MKRLKKIYYVPGIISLIVIPALFIFYASQKRKEINLHALDLGIPMKFDPNLPMEKQNSFEPYRMWNYKKIEVPPNKARENSANFVSQLRKLQSDRQEETGLEFILTDNNTYDDFISIINDINIAKCEMFGVDLDQTGHIFVLYQNRENDFEDDAILRCGTSQAMYHVDSNDYLKGFEQFTYQLSQLPKDTFFIIFSFLVFLQIAVLSLVQKHI